MPKMPKQIVTSKVCLTCKLEKPVSSYYAHRSTKDRRANNCNDCEKARRKRWVADNAERVRAYNAAYRSDEAHKQQKRRDNQRWWLKQYGLTPAEYDAMLAEQDGLCAICGMPERGVDPRSGLPRRLAVDHNHATSKVRGLLCLRCNQAIGQFADEPARLHRAIEYLRRSEAAS